LSWASNRRWLLDAALRGGINTKGKHMKTILLALSLLTSTVALADPAPTPSRAALRAQRARHGRPFVKLTRKQIRQRRLSVQKRRAIEKARQSARENMYKNVREKREGMK